MAHFEEHDGIGDLGQDQRHLAFHVTPDQPGSHQHEHDSGHGKDQRYREDRPLEPLGQQTIHVHQHDEGDDSEHAPSTGLGEP